MDLKKFDNKCVRIIDIDDIVFEGNCTYNDKVHNDRLMLCLKDNIDKFDDKDRINKLIEKKN